MGTQLARSEAEIVGSQNRKKAQSVSGQNGARGRAQPKTRLKPEEKHGAEMVGRQNTFLDSESRCV